MNRLLACTAVCLLSSGTLAQPQSPQPPQPPPQQTDEWLKQMRIFAQQMIGEGDAARAKGLDDVALDRYVAAREMYKNALDPEVLQKLNTDISALRAKLGIADPDQPAKPTKQVNLSDPNIATRRTDALRLLSEAEQYFEEGKYYEAGTIFTRLNARFLDTLLDEEENRVKQGVVGSRERLGLPPSTPGQADFLPYIIKSGDAEIDSVCQIIAGSFATDAKGASADRPQLTLNSAAVKLTGVTNAVYFEVCRADDVPHPFRQGFLTFYRLDKQLRLRILDIPAPELRNAVVSLWAAPDMFPGVALESLSVNADLVMTRNEDGSGYTARTSGRVPTLRGGAVLMTSLFRVGAEGITIDDRGYDAQGKEVWRSGTESGVAFLRAAAPNIVTRKESGLVVIDLARPRDEQRLAAGGQIVLHVSYWTDKGNLLFTSRNSASPPRPNAYPTRFMRGLDDGLAEIGPGGWRRIVVPPDLAVGQQGRPPQVPADAGVIFDVECLWIKAPPEPPPGGDQQGPVAPPAKPAGGH